MRFHSLTHLSDAVLLRDLAALIAHDRVTTAVVLAHIGEVDARRLYAPAGYPSMHAYCVGELRLSEDAASKRIQAARAARRFPVLFAAVAEGRLHLAAVCLLAPHLTAVNVERLVELATHRSKAEVEELLAPIFSMPELLVAPVVPAMFSEHAPGHVRSDLPHHSPGHVEHAPGHIGSGCAETIAACQAVGPTEVAQGEQHAETERFLLKVTIGRRTREKLHYAQALLSHVLPSGDMSQVLDRALDALIVSLEKRKLGVDTRQRAGLAARRSERRRPGSSPVLPAGPCPTPRNRYVPARIRRAVWERDRGRCTFVSPAGHRCQSRRFLEFDHIVPVARGGRASVEGMRLRCHAHNQYEAERVFGVELMRRKRHERRRVMDESRARTASNMPRGMLEVTDATKTVAERQAALDATKAVAGKQAALNGGASEQVQDVVAGLRNLGCRANEARRAAEFTGTLQDVTLEERMRAALTFLGRR